MKLALTERFQRDIRELADHQKAALLDVLLSLPGALGEPHLHSGLGIRKLHRSGIWEARVGLGLRIVFSIERDLLNLVRAGAHAEVQRYLREL
jgi:mRNA-degrading endonuclease YafQ of YafQ-DinJ toxin-antitoxin module